MRFDITHSLEYRYSQPVFLEPMTLRLRPRSDGTQQVESYRLTIDPEPAGRTETLDLFGNPSTRVWFEKQHEQVRFEAECRVATTRANPFDFLLERAAQSLPMPLDPEFMRQIAVYLDAGGIDPEVAAFAEEMASEAGMRPLETATRLSQRISERSEWTTRAVGPPWRPERTYGEAKGSCRDLAMLFITAARKVGLPARFVSGYQHQRPDDPQKRKAAKSGDELSHELHAWAEVYLPGAGWRGFDPSAGLLAADHHIAVAAAPDHASTMPSEGSFRGTGATSELIADVKIREVPAEEAAADGTTSEAAA